MHFLRKKGHFWFFTLHIFAGINWKWLTFYTICQKTIMLFVKNIMLLVKNIPTELDSIAVSAFADFLSLTNPKTNWWWGELACLVEPVIAELKLQSDLPYSFSVQKVLTVLTVLIVWTVFNCKLHVVLKYYTKNTVKNKFRWRKKYCWFFV